MNLLGLDLLSALVTRLQDRFRTHIGMGESLCCGASAGSDPCLASSGSVPVLPSLMDRLGDARDQVREQDQVLLLKIMEQAASPQVVHIRPDSPHRHQSGWVRTESGSVGRLFWLNWELNLEKSSDKLLSTFEPSLVLID